MQDKEETQVWVVLSDSYDVCSERDGFLSAQVEVALFSRSNLRVVFGNQRTCRIVEREKPTISLLYIYLSATQTLLFLSAIWPKEDGELFPKKRLTQDQGCYCERIRQFYVAMVTAFA